MKPIIITACFPAVIMMACAGMDSEPLNSSLPLPDVIQFQNASYTVVEGMNTGDNGEPASVDILTNELPEGTTQFFVIMRYKDYELSPGNYSPRFRFDGSHTKFDGSTSTPVIVENSKDDLGVITTIIEYEFERDHMSAHLKIGAHNDGLSQPDEVATLEVTTVNPLTGIAVSGCTLGERKSASVIIKDF